MKKIYRHSAKYLFIAVCALALTACGGDSSQSAQLLAAQSKQLHRSEKVVASSYDQSVQALYVAYFGRPADPNGLVNFENELAAANAPTDIAGLVQAYATNPQVTALVNSFETSAESNALYGSATTTAFVTSIFQNVLGRPPAAQGLAFWVNAIDSGSLTQGDAALSIMAGAMSNTTPQGLLDAQLINNRLAVADYFTSQLTTQNIVSSYSGHNAASIGRLMLNAVSASTSVADFEANDVGASFTSLLASANGTPVAIGGTVSGLSGSLTLNNNGADPLVVTANGAFTFSAPVAGSYLVTIAAQPAGQSCALANASGNATATVNSVSVTCTTNTLTSYFVLDVDKTNIPDGIYGFSIYTAMWPMISQPYANFEVGLVGTWLNPDNLNFNQPLVPLDHPFRTSAPFMAPYYRGYQTIEGSGGYWISTHFPSTQPKYRINGTPNGYVDQLSAPGWEFGSNAVDPSNVVPWGQPMGSAGVGQLSNHLLVPPDGLTFKAGTNGELFGAAWMALPLTTATSGANSVGNLSWTFFINSTNFQGPVLFYAPDVWEVLAATYPTASGRGMDAQPAVFAGGLAMEMGTLPFQRTTDSTGTAYGKLPALSFPADSTGTTYLSSDLTVYTNAALFTPFMNWLNGGSAISGQFSVVAAITPSVTAETLYMFGGTSGTSNFEQMESSQGLANYVAPTVVTTPGGGSAWALKWQNGVSPGAYPEYYKSVGDYMVPIPASQVPAGTGLTTTTFPTVATVHASYTSPTSWKTPAPAAGPFTAKLTDGSVVTYYWYRFIDQPSLQGFGWTTAQKNALQAVAEKIHKNWSSNTNFIPPQTVGNLATMDAALVVTPPAGLEIGYVPVVVGQAN
jgi:hypothetical protein